MLPHPQPLATKNVSSDGQIALGGKIAIRFLVNAGAGQPENERRDWKPYSMVFSRARLTRPPL